VDLNRIVVYAGVQEGFDLAVRAGVLSDTSLLAGRAGSSSRLR
jgi:hypothetical protein